MIKPGDRDLDVVGVGERGEVVLAGSCKWTAKPVDVREYASLQRDLTLSGLECPDPYLALFSRSGFTRRLRAVAAAQDPPRLLLVDLPTMYAV